MNIIQRFKYALTGRLPQGNTSLFPMGGQLINDFQKQHEFVKNGYMGNAIIYSIISQSSRKFSTVPRHLYQIKDKQAFSQYKALLGDGTPTTGKAIATALNFRRKAMVPVEKHPIIDLLNRPNPTQGGAAFFENLYGFKQINGAGSAWANRGGNPTGEPVELWCLPSADIVIVIGKNPDGSYDYLEPAGYQLQNGWVSNLRKEDVLYWKYFNPYWSSSGSHLYGLAPLEAGGMVANERNKADKTSATIMQNQGSKGVLYSTDPKGMSVDTRDKLQNRLDQEVNGLRNNGRVALANSPLGYVDLGRTTVELSIDAIKRSSKEDLCNVFSFPPVLLDPSKGTLANLEASIKFYVVNKVIPEWCGLRDDLNAWLLPMYKGAVGNLWIEPDFASLPELQEDLEKQVNAVMKIWPLTPNQMLEFLGWETDPNNPEMNKRYIPANLVPLDQVNQPATDISGDVSGLQKYGLLDY
ncbi:phage portal protein [Chitinophaga oryzae]|uniref:Phage portal protein n=1 Tax=Chitinophaga oryzae TaxID=2725414 RepID=A0ABX6LIA5_9BACT|nr:phage portal protein [Chitinophaga oryzae]QJB39737.1 phage portal protein [Chitinophaga oryzae]